MSFEFVDFEEQEQRHMNKREHLILDEFRKLNSKLLKELIPIRVALASCAYNNNALGNIGESYGIWKLISEFYSIDFLPDSIKDKYCYSPLNIKKWKKMGTRNSTTGKIECRLFRHLSLRGFTIMLEKEEFHTDLYETMIIILAPENPTEIIFDDIHDPEDENDITHCKVCHDRLHYSEICYGYDMCRRHLQGRKCSVCRKYDSHTNWEKTRLVPNKNFKCHECYWKSKQKIYQNQHLKYQELFKKQKKIKNGLKKVKNNQSLNYHKSLSNKNLYLNQQMVFGMVKIPKLCIQNRNKHSQNHY